MISVITVIKESRRANVDDWIPHPWEHLCVSVSDESYLPD